MGSICYVPKWYEPFLLGTEFPEVDNETFMCPMQACTWLFKGGGGRGRYLIPTDAIFSLLIWLLLFPIVFYPNRNEDRWGLNDHTHDIDVEGYFWSLNIHHCAVNDIRVRMATSCIIQNLVAFCFYPIKWIPPPHVTIHYQQALDYT